jgi:hypothetical protein
MLQSLNRSLFSCVIMHDFVNYASEQLDRDGIGKDLSRTAATLGRAGVKLGRRRVGAGFDRGGLSTDLLEFQSIMHAHMHGSLTPACLVDAFVPCLFVD